jgi:hypothetical protein
MRPFTWSYRTRAVLAALVAVALVAVGVIALRPARADVFTVSNDNLRTAWDSGEPELGPASVSSSDFGEQFAAQLDGQVYAQPLVVGDTLVVATEHNTIYGLDPATGSQKWSRSVGKSWPSSAIGCGDLTPEIGITSTPVYDPATSSLYFAAKVNDGADAKQPHWYMHAVDPSNGKERTGWPVTIAGAPSNDKSSAFDAMHEMQRPGLLLQDGVVYAAFGAHCDFKPYRGYVAGVSTSTAKMTSLWATEVGASNQGAGIWQSGGGLVSDGAGRAFLTTGNGVMPPAGPGTSPPGTLSESVVRLQTNPDKSLSTADFFSPANAPTLDTNDTDLGAGGPIALPDTFGTPNNPHVLVQQGKDGRIFLLDRDGLGGRSQGPSGTDAALGKVGPFQGQWGHPAAWSGDGGYVYVVGNGGPLRALKSGAINGKPALSAVGTSSDWFPYTSGSPVVTSNGSASGSGVVWVVQTGGSTGVNAQLRAYSAVPDGTGNLPSLYSAPIGTASKFAVPATSGGHVYVGTRDGKVLGFGRPAKSVLTGSPVDFGSVAVGDTTTKTMTLTATKALNITGISTSTPFAVTPPPLPHALAAGDGIDMPVSYTPGAPGAATGILSVTTDAGTVAFSLSGVGTQAGLTATPAAATFQNQPVGTTATVNVQVTNTGTTDETLADSTGPSGPYTVSGLPAAGTPEAVVPAGGSFVIAVTYAPTASGSSNSSITVPSTSGTLTIPVTGNAIAGAGKLEIVPSKVTFGTVNVGSPRTLNFDLTNTGNVPLTITKAKAPNSDFTSSTPLSEGVVIGPEQVIHQAVTFKPSKPGVQNDSYEITSDTGQGAIYVPLTGTGTGTVPAPSATTWSVNSAATLNGGDLVLTPAVKYKAGSAFYQQAVPTEGLRVAFTAQLGPGTGADGMTFTMLDPTKTSPASVGASGSGLGFKGLRGVAVTLNTSWNATANSRNFVGVTVGPGGTGGLVYKATAKVPTALRTGTHRVWVTVAAGHVRVWLESHLLLNVVPGAGTIPANAYVGFTGGTGGSADVHTVRSVSIVTDKAGAAGAPLTPAPVSVDFGTVLVGSTATATLTLTNKGGQPETVTKLSGPPTPYTAGLPAVGTVVAPGASVNVPVTFKPTTTGAYPESLTVTTTSGNAVVPVNGGGSATLPPLTASTWTTNGVTTLGGSTLTLTKDGQKRAAGTAVNSLAVSPRGLHATFTAQIGGAGTNGADGLTLALLDASAVKPTALGYPGSGLGVAGLPAVFAALDTYSNGSVTSHNFAAVGTSTAGTTAVTFLATNTSIPVLRKGTHTIDVTVTTASHMVVKIDGTKALDVAVTLPPKVLVAFTAGAGGTTDTHAVINPVIAYTSLG